VALRPGGTPFLSHKGSKTLTSLATDRKCTKFSAQILTTALVNFKLQDIIHFIAVSLYTVLMIKQKDFHTFVK